MVPEVFDYGPDGDDFYIAMAFVDGPSLESPAATGRSALAEEAAGHALWLCELPREGACAFRASSRAKPYRLVHNDLKPAHLMIPASGERKVLDFGIAKALEESRDLGTDIGRTIAYAAPERLVSDQVNPHADFWSLGVMLYEMVCGHRPYPAPRGPRFRRELEHAITSQRAAGAAAADRVRPAAAIINRLLAFQVEHRYPERRRSAATSTLPPRDVPSAVAIYETPATTPVRRARATSCAVAGVYAVAPQRRRGRSPGRFRRRRDIRPRGRHATSARSQVLVALQARRSILP